MRTPTRIVVTVLVVAVVALALQWTDRLGEPISTTVLALALALALGANVWVVRRREQRVRARDV